MQPGLVMDYSCSRVQSGAVLTYLIGSRHDCRLTSYHHRRLNSASAIPGSPPPFSEGGLSITVCLGVRQISAESTGVNMTTSWHTTPAAEDVAGLSQASARRVGAQHISISRALNLDCLGSISSFLRRSEDLSHWRLTCRIIAEAAEPYILRRLTIGSKQRLSDAHILLIETPRYATYVHDLRLVSDSGFGIAEPQARGAAWLIRLLCAAQNLRSFTAGSLDHLLLHHHHHTDIVATICSLQHLQTLSLADCVFRTSSQAFGDTVNMLQRLSCPLRSLSLDLHLSKANRPPGDSLHVFDVLKRFAPTLETLRILDRVDIEKWDAKHSLPLFGRLRSLRIDRAGSVHVPSLEAACPFIRELTVQLADENIGLPPWEENVRHQLTFWTRLDLLVGTTSGIASLSLRGLKVEVLDLWNVSSRQLEALVGIRASLNSELLRVSFCSGAWTGPWLAELPCAGVSVLELKIDSWPPLDAVVALVCLSRVY
jgi:hypothetical protein